MFQSQRHRFPIPSLRAKKVLYTSISRTTPAMFCSVGHTLYRRASMVGRKSGRWSSEQVPIYAIFHSFHLSSFRPSLVLCIHYLNVISFLFFFFLFSFKSSFAVNRCNLIKQHRSKVKGMISCQKQKSHS